MTKLLRLSTALGLIFALMSPSVALAELIIDPDGVGATGVNGGPIRNGVFTRPGPVLDFAQRDLRIGEGNITASGGAILIPATAGSVVLNASAGTNSIVGFSNIERIYLGSSQSGKLVIDGQGTAGGAFVNVFDMGTAIEAGRVDIGFGFSSSLEVVAGGLLSIDGRNGGTLAIYDNTESNLRVDGVGSRIDIAGSLSIGSNGNVIKAQRSIVVSNGGVLNAFDNSAEFEGFGEPNYVGLLFGDLGIGNNAQVSVTGAGSVLAFGSGRLALGSSSSTVVADGGELRQNARDPSLDYSSVNTAPRSAIWLSSDMGLGNAAALTVSGAGSRAAVRDNIQIGDDFGDYRVNPVTGNFERFYSAGQGKAVVENSGLLKTDSTIYVSGNRNVGSTGNLTVRTGGTVQADKIVINTGGVLNGNGGTVIGDVELQGGTVAPGASPGTMTVNGDFDFFSGIIDFEIGGANPGEFDVLNVLGNFKAYEGSIFRFTLLAGYTPTATSAFNFLNIGGTSNFDLVKPTFQFAGFGDTPLNVFASNGRFSLAATDPNGGGGPSPVPLPASVLLLAAALFGLTWLKKGKGMVTA